MSHNTDLDNMMNVTIPSPGSIYHSPMNNYIGSYNIGNTSNSSYQYSTVTTSAPMLNINQHGIRLDTGQDITIEGHSLKEFMKKMQDRLCILQPDPAKLAKYESLRLAYEHYKLMEQLLGDD